MNRLALTLLAWRMPLFLGILCLGLGLVVGRMLTRPGPALPPAAGEIAADDDEAAADQTFAADPLSSFTATIERPLFIRSRRPPPPERTVAADARPGESTAPFLLSGVLIVGRTRVALIQPRAQPKTVRALEGETIEGWKIEKILPERVVISSSGVREELRLLDRIAPPAVAAATQPRERATARPPLPPPLREPLLPQRMPPPPPMEGTMENEPESQPE